MMGLLARSPADFPFAFVIILVLMCLFEHVTLRKIEIKEKSAETPQDKIHLSLYRFGVASVYLLLFLPIILAFVLFLGDAGAAP